MSNSTLVLPPLQERRAASPDRLTEEEREFVARNRGLGAKVCTRKLRDQNDFDEIMSISDESMCRAVMHWDPSIASYSTYATWAVTYNIAAYREPKRRENRDRAFLAGCSQIDPDDTASHAGGEWIGEADPEPTNDRDALLHEAIGRLHEREREVIRARYFAGETLAAIGARLGCTKERVRQIEMRAKDQLRRLLEGKEVA